MNRHGRFNAEAGSFVGEEEPKAAETHDERYDDTIRGPGIFGSCPGKADEQRGRGRSEEEVPSPVDPLQSYHERRFIVDIDVKKEEQCQDRYTTEWKVEIEHPAPGSMLDNESAEEWSKGSSESNNGKHNTQPLASIPKWEQVTDNDLDENSYSTCSDSLDSSACNQHRHGVGAAAYAAS